MRQSTEDSRKPNGAGTPGEVESGEVLSSWEALWTELQNLLGGERQTSPESQQLAATILLNMGTGLVVINSQGRITECNPAARAVLAHRILVGRGYREVFWPDWTGEAGETPPPGLIALEECLRRGTPVRRLQMTYQDPNGQKMVLGVGFSPIRSASGAIGGAVCLLTDLTEITALQQQVRLKENMAALGEMSAGIAHEFKNSLATIGGYAQLIDTAGLEEARLFAGKIYSESRFLARIVTDFLNFSRPLQMVASPADLRDLLEESFAELCDRGECQRVRIEFEGEFPVMQGDITLLRQAFSNLLRNGCQAMAGKEGCLRVRSRLETGEQGPLVRLDFQDEGPGIEPEHLDKVFIPFFTTKDTGTGLGLALVHKIVVHHGGTIRVESTPGGGATFTLTLPLAPRAEEAR